jgi:hypothetical protein
MLRLKIYLSDDFEGHGILGTAAIIKAHHPLVARRLLKEALEEQGIPCGEFSVRELKPDEPGVEILSNGDY